MRLKARTAIAGLPIACAASAGLALLLCAAPLAARPTRPIPHPESHKLVLAPPQARERQGRSSNLPARRGHLAAAKERRGGAAARGSIPSKPAEKPALRVAGHGASHPAAGKISAAVAMRHAAKAPDDAARVPVDPATIDRVHAWERTQQAAAIHGEATDTGAADSEATLRTDAAAEAGAVGSGAGQNGALTRSLLAGMADTALLRTSPELPRLKSIEEEAATPVLLPSLYDARGRLVVPPPLYGSREVLLHQNQMADRDGLSRVRDDADLLGLRREKKLVPLPAGEALRVDERLPANRRFSRPWTAEFLAVLGRDFYASFHEPLQVNSAVRTVQFQQRLLRTNGNAAPAAGDTASPHLTGQAVDIGKRGLSPIEIAWMRTYLAPLIEQGKIDVEEEFQQACFHISVYRIYSQPIPDTRVAASRRPYPTTSGSVPE